MNRDRFDELLGSLPRESAGHDFTARVLARLPEPATSRPGSYRWRYLAVTAAAALVAIAVLLGVLGGTAERRRETAEREAALARVEQLRREYEDLQAELEQLRRLSAELEPVIGVAGDEEVDYLLDLRDLLQAEPRSGPPAGAQPVSWER